MRILVVHLGGVGDFLLMCPTLVRLRETGSVELLGRRERLDIAVDAGIADAAHNTESVDFESVFVEPTPRLRAFLAPFDRCLVWMRDDGTIQNAIRRCGIEDVSAFPGLPPENWTRHASQYYAHCLGMRDLPALRLRFRPEPVSHDVVIHAGSGGKRKNWPVDRFVVVGQWLESRGLRVAWSRGPAEEDLELPPSCAVMPTMSLSALAGTLAGSRLYVGNDCGITHLAAATGCPTIAVFGPTDPRVWAPRGSHVTPVCGSPWPDIDAVLSEVERRLSSDYNGGQNT